MKKTHIIMNKPSYSSLAILKTVFSVFWYGYVKPKHGEKSKIMSHGQG